ncbi:MAG TPA: flagellar export chaperone FliS [Bryobacteraceae bacterium]|jgi:flagellar protein FliS|nr:flagellar export chaperone FliS [Bryobacteraceae bacterium]
MTPSSRQKEYLAIRITTASPMELVRILYEGAVQSVHEAIRALHSGDILGRGQAINKAIEILAELRVSLRRDVQEQYSNTLAELYGYIQHQLIQAHAEQSESKLQEAARLLNTLLEGWSGAIEKASVSQESGGVKEAGQAADAVIVANPYSTESPGLRLESRTWQL